jgi:hypothetical protein
MSESEPKPDINEMIAFLVQEGWEREDHDLSMKVGPGERRTLKMPMFRRPGPKTNTLVSVSVAYKTAVWEKENRDLETYMENREGPILCNMCGQDCAKYETFGKKLGEEGDPKERNVGYYGLINANLSGGFFSENDMICDLTTYNFSICEDCMGKIFKQFKIPPKETRF